MKEGGFIAKYSICNNELVENAEVKAGFSVYEVVKIISGIPLFFESHMKRLSNSLQLSGISDFIITPKEFLHHVLELCKSNQLYFGNIELRVVSNSGNIDCYIGFIRHSYPQPMNYISGIEASLINIERDNPNAKVKYSKARIEADKFLAEKDVFEVLLVDDQGYITEGSRSNMFFIKESVVYTAPIENVLPGITRKYVIEALRQLGVEFIEQKISIDELQLIDAVFMCGTSPGILPVRDIDGYGFDVNNKLLRAIMLRFNDIIKQYVIKNSTLGS